MDNNIQEHTVTYYYNYDEIGESTSKYARILINNKFDLDIYIDGDIHSTDSTIRYYIDEGILKPMLEWSNIIASTNLKDNKEIYILTKIQYKDRNILGGANILEHENKDRTEIVTDVYRKQYRVHYPSKGVFKININQTLSMFKDTTLHEIGHIFSISTSHIDFKYGSQPIKHVLNVFKCVQPNNNLLLRVDAYQYNNDYFIVNNLGNSKAIEAYIEYFNKFNSSFTIENVKGILIEDNYGDGTAHYHPEQDNNNYIKLGRNNRYLLLPGLQNSIMIGMAGSYHNYYISKITIGYLQDMGYEINNIDKIHAKFKDMHDPSIDLNIENLVYEYNGSKWFLP